MKYIAALDQGTTSSRCILFDRDHNIAAISQKEFAQFYPKEGYVEQSAIDIYVSQYAALFEAVERSGVDPKDIAGIGITNQRETTIVWERATGKPVCNAIVWQCRRTAPFCAELSQQNPEFAEYIRENTGLMVDAYFSATKVKWILDHVEGAREAAERGDLLFGTVDTWLVWKLTGGRAHVTDYTNASRTMMFNLKTLRWDERILKELGIPPQMLPEVRNSSEIYGYTNIHGIEIPICGIAGDQQAALFGQTCFHRGEVKNTYGTGCFMLMNTGSEPCRSSHGLLTTIASGIGGKIHYALEGSVFIGGALLQWLRDEMMFFKESADADYFGGRVSDCGGVYIVPAFTGLGAPHWDSDARGAIFGLTRGTSKNHIIRASLEAIAFQCKDVLEAMKLDTGLEIPELKVDGGASVSDIIMQFEADIMDTAIVRPMIRETTALGAAYFAGLAVDFWEDEEDIKSHWTLDTVYRPQMDAALREEKLRRWNAAVASTRMWK